MKKIEAYLKPWWAKVIFISLVVILSIVLVNYMDLKARALEARDPKKYQSSIIRRSERILKRLAIVPSGETPAVATIVDVENLKRQNPEFYKRAQNGNTVILYKTVAFIIDEKAQKVVNIGPVFAN